MASVAVCPTPQSFSSGPIRAVIGRFGHCCHGRNPGAGNLHHLTAGRSNDTPSNDTVNTRIEASQSYCAGTKQPKSMSDTVPGEGINIVYAPTSGPVAVDILLVHGLQGHPYKTWACSRPKKESYPAKTTNHDEHSSHNPKGWHRVIPKRAKERPDDAPFDGHLHTEEVSPEYEVDPKSPSIYWPRDLLPNDCQNARILVYGYDTRVTKYLTGATSKNTVLSHAKDLLFALSRVRPRKQPLIVVAHSLGGIVVKEVMSTSEIPTLVFRLTSTAKMLARSASSGDVETQDIVESVASIIFLGTPHRGSPELAAMGELARSLVSALRMETTSTILDALGLRTTDLERAQESFSSLWHEYDFRVKTFQEGMGLTALNLGVLGNKVVPDHSSIIGDHRERAETVHANHMNMCRFWGADDPNYGRVAGEIRSVYQAIAGLSRTDRPRQAVNQAAPLKRKRGTPGSESDKFIDDSFVQSLWYPSMYSRSQDIDRPDEGTCHWLFEHQLYQDWFHGTTRNHGHGLLRLRGKPGTGKSILMKEAFRRTMQAGGESNCLAASFFFDPRGDPLNRDPVGMFRSLLHQLLPKLFQSPHASWSSVRQFVATTNVSEPGCWTKSKLKDTFQRALYLWPSRLYLFVDGLDACGDKDARELAFIFREFTNSAHDNTCDLRICISSRHFPTITIADCPDIIVDDHNSQDLALYINRRFQLGLSANEPQWRRLSEKILEKSAGVFLWVVLVVDEMIRQSDEGHDINFLLDRVDILPIALETLYKKTISSIPQPSKGLALRLFTWAVLAQKPLRINEWHHILAFIKEPAPPSLSWWRKSVNYTRNDDQLEKQIRNISRGLVEVKRSHTVLGIRGYDLDVQSNSMYAGAGSLNLEHGESRIVQVIHESVRGFFLERRGFFCLDPFLDCDGHIFIMKTCLQYIRIQELDALVLARRTAAMGDPPHAAESKARTLSKALDGGRKKSNIATRDPSRELWQATLLEPGRPDNPEMVTGPTETPTFEMIRERPCPMNGIDIHLWLAEVLDLNTNMMDVDEAVPKSPTQLSVVGPIRVLEDHPALLSYVTSELFTHAQLAHRNGANPLDAFEKTDSWDRWVALREDIPRNVSLWEYAASLGLYGPPKAISKDPEMAAEQTHRAPLNENPPGWHDTWLGMHVSRPTYSGEASRHTTANTPVYEREGSVASFASAGSHMSHPMASPVRPARRNSSPERNPFFSSNTPERNPFFSSNTPEQNPFIRSSSDNPFAREFPSVGLDLFYDPSLGSDLEGPWWSRKNSNSDIYTCTYYGCTERFETPAMLQRHKEEGHRATADGIAQSPFPAYPHRCDRINPSTGKPCNTIFSRPYDLTRHEDTIHNSRKQKFRCDLCTDEKTFSRADALTRHYRVRHPDVEFPGKRRRVGRRKSEDSSPMAGSKSD